MLSFTPSVPERSEPPPPLPPPPPAKVAVERNPPFGEPRPHPITKTTAPPSARSATEAGRGHSLLSEGSEGSEGVDAPTVELTPTPPGPTRPEAPRPPTKATLGGSAPQGAAPGPAYQLEGGPLLLQVTRMERAPPTTCLGSRQSSRREEKGGGAGAQGRGVTPSSLQIAPGKEGDAGADTSTSSGPAPPQFSPRPLRTRGPPGILCATPTILGAGRAGDGEDDALSVGVCPALPVAHLLALEEKLGRAPEGLPAGVTQATVGVPNQLLPALPVGRTGAWV